MPSLVKAYHTAINMGRTPQLVIPFKVETTPKKRSEFGDNILEISAEVEGSQHPYNVLIVLPNSSSLALDRITSRQLSRAKWWCDCSDFRFTFHPHIDTHGHALRSFPEYIPNGRGQPRAIDDYGMCKHIMSVIHRLIETRDLMPSHFME